MENSKILKFNCSNVIAFNITIAIMLLSSTCLSCIKELFGVLNHSGTCSNKAFTVTEKLSLVAMYFTTVFQMLLERAITVCVIEELGIDDYGRGQICNGDLGEVR